MLEDHKELKNGSKIDSESSLQCERCEQKFPYPFLMKKHACTPVYKYPRERCTFIALGLRELLVHMDKSHVQSKRDIIEECEYPEKVSKQTEEEEKENVEKFETQRKNETANKCDQCDFVADDIPSFISNIRNEHKQADEPCNYCEYIDHDKDAEIIMIHTMGKQMNDFTESFALCKTLHN